MILKFFGIFQSQKQSRTTLTMAISITADFKLDLSDEEIDKQIDTIIANVSIGEPDTDKYNNINLPIKYRRNGKEGPLTIKLPLVHTDSYGVMTYQNENGSGSHSIKIVFPRFRPIFVEEKDPETGEITGGHYQEPETVNVYKKVPKDPNDPKSPLVDDLTSLPEVRSNRYREAEICCKIFDRVYDKVIDYIIASPIKQKLGFGAIKKREIIEPQIKRPVYRKFLEDETEDFKYPPSTFFKFIESGSKGKEPNKIFTTFTGIDEKSIHPMSLENTMIYGYPTVSIERVFLGSKKNFQCKVSRMTVVDTIAREETSEETKQIQDIIAQNPNMVKVFLNNLSNVEKFHGQIKRENDYIKKPKKNDDSPSKSPRSEPESPSEPPSTLDKFMETQQEPAAAPVKKIIPRRGTMTAVVEK